MWLLSKAPMSLSIACEDIVHSADFRHLLTIDGIVIDLRYATTNNFVGRDLYSPLDCAWLHSSAAAGLEQAVIWLTQKHSDLKLAVLDALRPQRVQEQLWAALDGTDLRMYLANPANGSIHSFGMALDVTLLDAEGNELDMGSPFDSMTELSHPIKERVLLERGAITQAHIDNRQLLRNAMLQGNFHGINSEWWHFDCGDRALVRATYPRVM
jgi:zinc D-Ala-D-Ala dipeptidase